MYKIIQLCNGDYIQKLENMLNEGWIITRTDSTHNSVYYILRKS